MNDQQIDDLIAYLQSIQIAARGLPGRARPTRDQADGRSDAAVTPTRRSAGRLVQRRAYSAPAATRRAGPTASPSVGGGGAYGPEPHRRRRAAPVPDTPSDQVDFVTTGAELGKRYGTGGIGSMAPAVRSTPSRRCGHAGGGMPGFGADAHRRPDPGRSSSTSGASDAMHATSTLLADRPGTRASAASSSSSSPSVVLLGSVYLILATNIGARLGFLVALAGLVRLAVDHGHRLVDRTASASQGRDADRGSRSQVVTAIARRTADATRRRPRRSTTRSTVPDRRSAPEHGRPPGRRRLDDRRLAKPAAVADRESGQRRSGRRHAVDRRRRRHSEFQAADSTTSRRRRSTRAASRYADC